MKLKGQVEDAYLKFQEQFVKYFYDQLSKAHPNETEDRLKNMIIEKWKSYARTDLKEMFIVYQKMHNMDFLNNFKCKHEKDPNDEVEDFPYGVKHYKKCLKMFGEKHFPVYLAFEFYNDQSEEINQPNPSLLNNP